MGRRKQREPDPSRDRIRRARSDVIAALSTAGTERGAVARRVLRGLGINVDAPIAEYRRAYGRFLPEAATEGIFPLLHRAGDVSTADDEVRWLAKTIRVEHPEPGDAWWGRLWQEAAGALPQEPPTRLGFEARVLFLRTLLEEEGPNATVHALKRAMRLEVGS